MPKNLYIIIMILVMTSFYCALLQRGEKLTLRGHIFLPDGSKAINEEVYVQLKNISGQEIKKITVDSGEFNLGRIEDGNYLLECMNGKDLFGTKQFAVVKSEIISLSKGQVLDIYLSRREQIEPVEGGFKEIRVIPGRVR